MSREQDSKLAERNIPGMMNRRERFAEPEHADDIKATVRRIAAYFVEEKRLVAGMLAIVERQALIKKWIYVNTLNKIKAVERTVCTAGARRGMELVIL